jgi:5-dehydro-4-deoxyglucarate dehydratase
MRDFVSLQKNLAGVHNYLPAPFFSDYRLDVDGMRGNVAFHASTNHDDMTITVGGGYGEGFTLDLEEHKELVSAAVEGADGKIHVMAGVVGGYGIQRAMARNAEEAGAGSIIVFVPRFQTPTPDVAYSYLRDLAESVDLGVVIFPFGSHAFWPNVLERLAVVSNIIGFLAPNISIEHTVEFGKVINSIVPGRYLWIAENEDHAMSSFPHGCLAYTAAAPAIVPEASREFWKYGVQGDEDLMVEVFGQRIEPINKIRSLKPGYGISGIKVALEMLGRAGGPPRPVDTHVTESDRSVIWDILASHPDVKHLLDDRHQPLG